MTLAFKAFEWRAEAEGGDYSIDRLPRHRFVAYFGKDAMITVDGKAEWPTLSEAVDACVKHNTQRLAPPPDDEALSPARPRLLRASRQPDVAIQKAIVTAVRRNPRQPDVAIQKAIVTAVRRNPYITSVERACAAVRYKGYVPSAATIEVRAMLANGTLVWSGSCLRESRVTGDREKDAAE